MGKKNGLADLIGRTIVAVTVLESENPPREQLFLTLDDGRYYELWSQPSGLGVGSMTYDGGLEEVQGQRPDRSEIVFEVVADDKGQPRQTVAKARRDEIEDRKSRRGSDRERT